MAASGFYEQGGLDVLFYDAATQDRDHDLAYYVGLALRHGGPVVDLGCGAGRVACALATQGIDVVGVDASSAMIAVAHERLAALPAAARSRVRLVESDIAALALELRAPLVVSAFRTLQILPTDDALCRVFEWVRRTLGDAGRFAFDVWSPPRVEPVVRGARRVRVQATRGGRVHHGDVELRGRRYDEARRTVVESWQFRLLDASGEAVLATQARTFGYRVLPDEHVQALLGRCGLHVERLHRAGSRDVPGLTGHDRVWLVRKD